MVKDKLGIKIKNFKNLSKLNIGILGGSFDPAHLGHVSISSKAIKFLNLKQMWWLVASQNPLKEKNQKKSLQNRLLSAKLINKNYKIKTLALEKKIGTSYSYDTLISIKNRMPRAKIFWIMGADNLHTMHKWYKWKKLFYICPIIVFNRPGYFYKSLSSKAAKCYWRYKVDIRKINGFSSKNLPLWTFINNSYDHNSSTKIRRNEDTE